MTEADGQRVWRISALVVVVTFAVTANLFLPAALEDTQGQVLMNVSLAAIGGLLAEICLLALWAALGYQPLVVRLPITIGLSLVAICTFILGLRLADDGIPVDTGSALVLGLATLVMYGGIQSPLWMLRGVFGWRIVLSDAPQTDVTRNRFQFDLRYLLVVTAAVGVLLALFKVTLPTDGNWPAVDMGEFIQITVRLLIIATFSALVFLPCVWLTLAKRPSIAAALCLGGVLSCVPIGILAGLLVLLAPIRPNRAEMLGGIYSLAIGLVGTTAACLFVARALGYRLVREPRAQQEITR